MRVEVTDRGFVYYPSLTSGTYSGRNSANT